MPYLTAIAMILLISCGPTETDGLDPFIAGSPISAKKRSCKPPGVWLTSSLPVPRRCAYLVAHS
jgi:hypothetical protein